VNSCAASLCKRPGFRAFEDCGYAADNLRTEAYSIRESFPLRLHVLREDHAQFAGHYFD